MTPTRQEVFNIAWRGMQGQGFALCRDEAGPHRGPLNGLRCAMGYVWDAFPEVNIGGIQDQPMASFVFDLIMTHDCAVSAEDCERRMRDFAASHGVAIPDDGFAAFKARILKPLPEMQNAD